MRCMGEIICMGRTGGAPRFRFVWGDLYGMICMGENICI